MSHTSSRPLRHSASDEGLPLLVRGGVGNNHSIEKPAALKVLPLPPPPVSTSAESLAEAALVLLAVALGSYAGTLLRIGLGHLRPYRSIEVALATLYPNILGSFVLGAISELQPQMTGPFVPRLYRILYVLVASAFCGSLTTFSTYCFETLKLAILQFDFSPFNIATAYAGARAVEFLVQAWAGVAVPLAALRAGQALVQWVRAAAPASVAAPALVVPSLAPAAPPPPPARARPWHAAAEVLLGVSAAAATVLCVALPLRAGTPAFAYAAAFGAAGAYARYQLAFLNAVVAPPLPVGTLLANVLATWVFAAAALLSKYFVPYHNHGSQALLYGVQTGFCGCLSTMSTFALELHRLRPRLAIRYALASVTLAMVGLGAIYGAYTVSVLLPLTRLQPPIDYCAAYDDLCGRLLDHIACPAEARVRLPCAQRRPLASGGACACGGGGDGGGGFDASARLHELLVTAQVAANTTQSLAAVWPVQPSPLVPPESVIDACLSFENVCDHFLNRIGCPGADRALNACDRGGISAFVGTCRCGVLDVAAHRLGGAIVAAQLPAGPGFARAAPLDLCAAFDGACARSLAHIQCPPGDAVSVACANTSEARSFVGTCTCYGWDASAGVADAVFSAAYAPFLWGGVQRGANNFTGGVDACASFAAMCGDALSIAGCALADQRVVACNEAAAAGSVAAFNGTCTCASSAAAAASTAYTGLLQRQAFESLVYAALAEDIYERYTYRPPRSAPGPLLVSTTQFKPLIATLYPEPGYSAYST